jgi:hypothetical protein
MMSPGPESDSVELLEAAHEIVGLEPPQNLFIHQGYRRKAAGAEAVDDFHGQAVVGRGGARFDAGGFLDGFDGFGGTADVTGGSVTNSQKVLSTAFEVELGVERGNAMELGERDEGAFGDELESGTREVTQEILSALEDGDHGALLALELVQDGLQLIQLCKSKFNIHIRTRRHIRNHRISDAVFEKTFSILSWEEMGRKADGEEFVLYFTISTKRE